MEFEFNEQEVRGRYRGFAGLDEQNLPMELGMTEDEFVDLDRVKTDLLNWFVSEINADKVLTDGMIIKFLRDRLMAPVVREMLTYKASDLCKNALERESMKSLLKKIQEAQSGN